MSTMDTPGSDIAHLVPPVQWHDDDHHGHVVQFYREDEALLDSISRFIGTALVAGDAAVVIATAAHREGFSQRLEARGLDVAGCIDTGRYVALDAAKTLSEFMHNGWPDPARFAYVIGDVIERARAEAEPARPRVAAFGEMVALLWAEGKLEAALRLEQLWNDLARTHSFSLRCAYPIVGFNRGEHGEPFLKICAAHSSVIPSESYTSLLNDGERLRTITHLQQRAQALETERADRETAQKSLRHKESELADLLENAVEGVQQVGPDQKILWANQALLSLLGYTSEEYVNHRFADFHVDRNAFDEYWQKLMRAEDIYDYPSVLRCKDGSVKHVLIHSNGLWEDGQFIHTRCFVRDVTEHRRVEEALRESEANLRMANEKLESAVEQRTARLRQLSSRILTLQDDERRRIARELHDSLGQYLVGLKLNIDLLRQSPELSELWSQSAEIMEQCIAEVRTLSCLLHPPMIDELGLVSAARWFVQNLGTRSGIQMTLNADSDLSRLPAPIELVLFRCLQEALTNVHRHSGASAAEILIRLEGEQVVLKVRDNGRGMQPELITHFHRTGAGMGVGLSGMRERVGELGGRMKLDTGSDGTVLEIVIPVVPECVPVAVACAAPAASA